MTVGYSLASIGILKLAKMVARWRASEEKQIHTYVQTFHNTNSRPNDDDCGNIVT